MSDTNHTKWMSDVNLPPLLASRLTSWKPISASQRETDARPRPRRGIASSRDLYYVLPSFLSPPRETIYSQEFAETHRTYIIFAALRNDQERDRSTKRGIEFRAHRGAPAWFSTCDIDRYYTSQQVACQPLYITHKKKRACLPEDYRDREAWDDKRASL